MTDERRDMEGETVLGMRVAAWREPVRCPPDVDPAAFEEMFRHGKPNTYAEHWSTLREGAERLFTEADVHAALSRLREERDRYRLALARAATSMEEHRDGLWGPASVQELRAAIARARTALSTAPTLEGAEHG